MLTCNEGTPRQRVEARSSSFYQVSSSRKTSCRVISRKAYHNIGELSFVWGTSQTLSSVVSRMCQRPESMNPLFVEKYRDYVREHGLVQEWSYKNSVEKNSR
jgi:hypothetical protein